MSEEERLDGMYLSLTQQCRGIDPLLESLFSFLRRKTDFFSGAAPEKIESTVLAVIRKQAAIAEREDLKRKKAAADAKNRAESLRAKVQIMAALYPSLLIVLCSIFVC
jgi:N-terminal conserved domain of Nudc.